MNDKQRAAVVGSGRVVRAAMDEWAKCIEEAGIFDCGMVAYWLAAARVGVASAVRAVNQYTTSDRQLVDNLLKEVSGEADQGDDS